MLDGRARTTFRWTFAALAFATLVPIWIVRYHPLPDLPNHIAATAVWHFYRDPAYDFASYYKLSLGPTPYWGYYALANGLTWVVGLDVANRVILSSYALGLPFGILLLARRFERSEWLSLFAFPLVWNFDFVIGFVPYVLGVALLPFALVAFDRFCERPTLARGALAAAGGVGVFFCHLLPWGMWWAMAGLLGLVHRGRDWRTLLKRAAVWIVPVVVGVWVLRHGTGLEMGRFGHGVRAAWAPLRVHFAELPLYLLDVFATHEDEALALVLLVAFVALRATAPRARPLALHDLRALACFAVPAVAYFVLPRSLLAPNYWWGVNVRFAAPAALFAVLCVPGPVDGWRRWLLVPVAVAGIAFAVATTWHWRRNDQFCGARAFDKLASLPPRGARVLVLTYPPFVEPSSRMPFIWAYPALHQAFHGGYYPTNFDQGFPLVYTRRFPAPGFRDPEWFRWDYQARYYDYVLVAHKMHLGDGHADLVAADEPWSLWKVRGARIDEPPGPAYPHAWADDPDWRPGMKPH